jgi:hypothetical protein
MGKLTRARIVTLWRHWSVWTDQSFVQFFYLVQFFYPYMCIPHMLPPHHERHARAVGVPLTSLARLAVL